MPTLGCKSCTTCSGGGQAYCADPSTSNDVNACGPCVENRQMCSTTTTGRLPARVNGQCTTKCDSSQGFFGPGPDCGELRVDLRLDRRASRGTETHLYFQWTIALGNFPLPRLSRQQIPAGGSLTKPCGPGRAAQNLSCFSTNRSILQLIPSPAIPSGELLVRTGAVAQLKLSPSKSMPVQPCDRCVVLGRESPLLFRRSGRRKCRGRTSILPA